MTYRSHLEELIVAQAEGMIEIFGLTYLIISRPCFGLFHFEERGWPEKSEGCQLEWELILLKVLVEE